MRRAGLLVRLGLAQLRAQRPGERPDDEGDAEDQHADPRVEVDVDPGGLVRLPGVVGQPQDDQQDAPHDKQPADDAAQVKEVRRALGAGAAGGRFSHAPRPPSQKMMARIGAAANMPPRSTASLVVLVLSSTLAMPYTKPCSSSTGFGCVPMVTATDTTTLT